MTNGTNQRDSERCTQIVLHHTQFKALLGVMIEVSHAVSNGDHSFSVTFEEYLPDFLEFRIFWIPG